MRRYFFPQTRRMFEWLWLAVPPLRRDLRGMRALDEREVRRSDRIGIGCDIEARILADHHA